ncbi:MAG: hypothetical protein L3J70_05025 [Gammaproteobacteria bacterium]|nr:hypothetical protein [Gammaproteobacteria bacterium]
MPTSSVTATLGLYTYRILLLLLTPIFIIMTLHQYITRNGKLEFLLQRFGFSIPKLNSPIWIHCASVGEVNTAAVFIQGLKKKHPSQPILITTNTPTGKYAALKKFDQSRYTHCFLPIDFAWAIRYFLNRTKPQEAIILETELWPNMFDLCQKKKIPISIINARLSKKTLGAPKFILYLYKQCLLKTKQVLAQSKQQAINFESLGFFKAKNIGNLKWVTPPAKINPQNSLKKMSARNYIAAVSTHKSEEQLIANAMKSHLQKNKLFLLIIPRHAERGEALQQELNQIGFQTSSRSKNEPINNHTQIYIADTTGEVIDLIADSEFCIIGGSFIPHGGQNFLEAAALNKAVICGSHMHNFSEITALFNAANAIIEVEDEQTLEQALSRLITDTDFRDITANNAHTLFEINKGIVERYLAYF